MRFFFRRFIFKPAKKPPSNHNNKARFSSKPRMSNSATAAALYAVTVSSSSITGAVPEEAGKKEWHSKTGKGFMNPWESWKEFSGPQIMMVLLKRKVTGAMKTPDTTPPTVPVRKPSFLPSRSNSELRTTWLGHACHFVEFPSGLRVLFDPVFEERCSPFSFLGPKRYTEVPCQIGDIPTIDAVIISHSHYDHLSHPTIINIRNNHPNVHFFVPLRLKKWFMDSGLRSDQVTELDWWEERDLTLSVSNLHEKGASKGDLKVNKIQHGVKGSGADDITARIGCLPCQHTSARTGFDKSHTLWASWSVESGGKKVWFGGDTGYRAVPELPHGADDYGPEYNFPHCPAFKQIGQLRGPFDLGLIPIGAYDPRHLFSAMHANPFDSVNIFLDTGCKQALGIHWGTWVLTEEEVLEPPKLLKKALEWKGIPKEGVFDVCDIGESRVYGILEDSGPPSIMDGQSTIQTGLMTTAVRISTK